MSSRAILILLLLSATIYSCQQSRSESGSRTPKVQTVKQDVQPPAPAQQLPVPTPQAEAAYDSFLIRERLPYWVNLWFIENKEFTQSYILSDSLNPFYLEGDFNGDKTMDCAIYLDEKKSGKRGFVILHGKTQKHFIIAAGQPYDHAGSPVDDLEYTNIWRVVRERTAAPGVQGGPNLKLKGDAISIEMSEVGGGLIYWDGKGYKYFHQTC